MTDNINYKMSNAVVGNKRVYMRKRDMEEFEQELETSRLAAENPDASTTDAPASEKPVIAEKPSTAEQPSDNHDWKKRYTDLQSYSAKKVSDLEKQLKDATATKVTYPTSEEEMEAWVKEFPPLYNIMRTVVLKEKGNDPELLELKDKLKEVDEFRQQLANEKGKVELLKLHPDADDYDEGGVHNADFRKWYDEQDVEIKALLDSGIPSKIGRAISIFKKDLGIVTKTAQDLKKEASKGINLGPTKPNTPKEETTWSESKVNKLSSKQYEKYEPEIEEARRNGKFIYDISQS